MILVIILAFGLAVVIPFVLFPKVRQFLKHWANGLVLTGMNTNYVLVAITFTSVLAVTLVTFLLYKMACSAWAYLYTGDIVEQLVYARGVFSLEIAQQSPFKFKSLLSLIGTVSLQMAAGLFLYRSTGHLMRKLNQMLRSLAFNQESQLVFSFLGVCLFIAVDVVFYAQDIAVVSQYANILLLVVAKMSMLSSLVCVIHWQLLKKPAYLDEIQRYLDQKSIWQSRLASPKWVLTFAFTFALLCHLPAFLGLQFLQNNIILFVLNGVVLFVFFVYGYQRIFRKILDVLGRIMLLPEIGNSGLTPLWPTLPKKKQLLAVWVLLVIIALWKNPALLSFFITIPMMASLTMLVGFLIVSSILVITLYGLGYFANRSNLKNSTSTLDTNHLIAGGKIGLESLINSIRPALWVGGSYLLLISAFPKSYPDTEGKYSRSILSQEGELFYQELSDEGFYAMPIGYNDLPPQFVKSLKQQEDRGFSKQRSVLPNGSNWFGLSFVALSRFMSHGGGGSNLNMQLIKNEAYQGRRVQDVQRKFYELIAAYQLSLELPSDQILTLYLNRVPMFGGTNFKGAYMASIEAFGLPPAELNDLQSLLLIWSLKNSNSFRLLSGKRVLYTDLYQFEPQVKNVLLNRFELWKRQGFLDESEFRVIGRQRLNLASPNKERMVEVSTREFLKEQFDSNDGVAHTSLSASAQEAMKTAVSHFSQEFKDKLVQKDYVLASGSVAVEVNTGKIIAHQSTGPSVTDLVDFGYGYPIGSLMKPPVILSMLESGLKADDIELFDGRIGNPVVNNFSGKFSKEKVGIEKMLALSLNAPFNNITELINPNQIFEKNESLLKAMEIPADPAIKFKGKRNRLLNQINYPLGSRRMTPLDVAQVYQAIFNKGKWIALSTQGTDSSHVLEEDRSKQIYTKENCEVIKKAMAGTLQYGTGWRLKSRLPKKRTFYAKTGTTDNATHGWTVLSDGNLLIVSWVSYVTMEHGKLDFNNKSVSIPYGSGSRTAGVLATMIYKELDKQKFKKPGRFRAMYSQK